LPTTAAHHWLALFINGKKLVIEQCKAGVVETPYLRSTHDQPPNWRLVVEIWKPWRLTTANPDKPAAPFACINQIPQVQRQLWSDMEMCVEIPRCHHITSLGAREDINAAAHSYSGVVATSSTAFAG
jgi:nitronate monooxygenase